MQPWVYYAILSAVFAGATSILAKYGLQNVNADLGLSIRTTTIFIIVSAFAITTNKFKDFSILTQRELMLLILSGIATTLSWVFYYRAMKDGPISYVASIDKASIVITLFLSFVLLGEPMTPKVLIGSGLIFGGMLVLVWK